MVLSTKYIQLWTTAANMPIIHITRSVLLYFLKDLSKFVWASIVKNNESLKKISYPTLEKQRPDEDLFIGSTAEKIVTDGKPPKEYIQQFYSYIKDFATLSVYIIQKFPIDDKHLLMHK